MDYSPPGSCIHGLFQARVVEWGAIAFSVPFARNPFSTENCQSFYHFSQMTNIKITHFKDVLKWYNFILKLYAGVNMKFLKTLIPWKSPFRSKCPGPFLPDDLQD